MFLEILSTKGRQRIRRKISCDKITSLLYKGVFGGENSGGNIMESSE